MTIDTTRPRLGPVDAPQLAQLPFGLLSVAAEVPRADDHAQNGVWYEPLSGVTGGVVALDVNLVAQAALTPETFDASTQPGSFPTIFTNPFLIYAAVQANPVGHTVQEIQDRASAKLALNSGRWIERGLLTGTSGGASLTGSAAVLSGTAGAPVAVSTSVGIGLLEQWIGDNVGALGVMHFPRLVAGSLWNQVEPTGPRMLTQLATPVAFGPGYDGRGPTGAPAVAAGTAWLYASGPVQINRATVDRRGIPDGQKTSFANQVPQTTAYATEIVSVGIETGVAAVLVTL